MVVPLLLISLIRFIISKLVAGSKFPVGSSAIMISGSFNKALEMAILCCSPPESSLGYLLITSSSFTFFKTSEILLLIFELSFHSVALRTNSRFCFMVLLGKSLKS